MDLVNSIFSGVNYSLLKTSEVVNKIAGSPSCVKNTCLLGSKCIAFIDRTNGQTNFPTAVKNMKAVTEVVTLYALFNQIIYWLNPFDNSKIDQERLIEKLNVTLGKLEDRKLPKTAPNAAVDTIKNNNDIAKKIVKKTLEVSHYTQQEVYHSIQASLIQQGYDEKDVQEVLQDFKVILKPRPIVKNIVVLCGTFCNSANTLKILEKWDLIDLSKIVEKIGSQGNIFSILVRYPISVVCDAVTTLELTVTILDATKTLFKTNKKMEASESENAGQLKLERKRCLWSIAAAAADMASTTLPLFLTMNPTTLIILGIINKSTAILCFLNKP